MQNNSPAPRQYSTIVIGSGAGGSTAFLELSRDPGTILVEEGSQTGGMIKHTSLSETFSTLYRNSGIRPAVGFPTVAVGEGRCLGGSTEINGGLFWRTPEFILEEWEKRGIEFACKNKLKSLFEELERELRVEDEIPTPGYDLDSQILLYACNQKNWKVVSARRMAPGCEKSNLCPIGCPTGAKQTMSTTFIPKGVQNGGVVLTGWRAVRISPQTREVKVHFENEEKESLVLAAPQVVVSCGAIESRRLLQQSGLLKQRIGRIGFHVNTKVIVEFPEKINSQNGTIFNYQLQEFIQDGFLMMSSNFNPAFFTMAANTLNVNDYQEYRRKLDQLAIFTLQFNPKSKLLDFHVMGKTFMLLGLLKKAEISRIRRYLQLSADLLFDAGAKSMKLPFLEQPIVFSKEEAAIQISKAPRSALSLTSVHLMSSLPVPGDKTEDGPLDKSGRLKKDRRIRVLDASILPTNIGESPQGSIMAIVRYLIRNEDK